MKEKKRQFAHTCWAKPRGGCEGGISGEHVISDCPFDEGTITAQGAPFTAGETRVIGKNRLRRKILCREHNRLLSPVDTEGGRAFKGIAELDNWLAFFRGRLQPAPKTLTIKGQLLERWFIKTTINLFVSSKTQRTWFDDAPPTQPPRPYVDAAFGDIAPAYPVGLYWSGGKVGDKVGIRGELGFTPIYDANRLIGARYVFRGMSFLLWLVNAVPPWSGLAEFHRHIGVQLRDDPNQADLVIAWPPGWRDSPAVIGKAAK